MLKLFTAVDNRGEEFSGVTPRAEPFNFTASPSGLDENVKTLHVMLDEITHVTDAGAGDWFEVAGLETFGVGVHPAMTVTTPVVVAPQADSEADGPGEEPPPPGNFGGMPFFPKSHAISAMLRTAVAESDMKRNRINRPSDANNIYCSMRSQSKLISFVRFA